jgi:hypothetical protein
MSGVAAVGHALTTTNGAWESSVPVTAYSYRWERCTPAGTSCAAISGATAASYSVVTADAGHTLRVAVAAENAAGWSSAEVSNATSVVAGVPAAQALPTVAGTAAVGKLLSGTKGSWSWNPTGYAHQWQRCAATGSGCSPIAGATSATHRVVAADAGHTLAMTVSATNAAGSGAATSRPTAVVVARPAVQHSPSIAGKTKAGRRLTGRKGNWSGSPAGYRYHWLRCSKRGSSCHAIPAASRPTYHLGRRDVGHRIRMRVTATNAAGSAGATSRPTRVISRS